MPVARRLLAVLALACVPAAAGDAVDEVREALYRGDPDTILGKLDEHMAALARDPASTRMVCAYAADMVVRIQPRLKKDGWKALSAKVKQVASEALANHPHHVQAAWAEQEALVLHERLAYRNATIEGLPMGRAARQISRLLERGRRARIGYERAIDLMLECTAQEGGNWFAGAGGLVYLSSKMKHHDVPDHLHACVAAALATEEAFQSLRGDSPDRAKAADKVRYGLKALAPFLDGSEPPEYAIARHNDLRAVASSEPALNIGTGLRLVWRTRDGLRYGVPLSRTWKILDAGAGESIWHLEPDGRPRREIRIHAHEAKADPKRLSRAAMLADQRGLKSRKKKDGPKKSALNARIAECLEYEVSGLDANKSFRRYRGFWFKTKRTVYSVHVTEHEDFGADPGVDMKLFLDSIHVG